MNKKRKKEMDGWMEERMKKDRNKEMDKWNGKDGWMDEG